jgi:hypothetical protein
MKRVRLGKRRKRRCEQSRQTNRTIHSTISLTSSRVERSLSRARGSRIPQPRKCSHASAIVVTVKTVLFYVGHDGRRRHKRIVKTP